MSIKPEERRANFRAWLEREDLNVAEVAERSGIPKSTLYGWNKGHSRTLKSEQEAKIAAAYGMSIDEVFGAVGSRRAPVVGKIGARAEVRPFDESADPMYEVELPATLNPEEEFVAFEVEGFSMPPAKPGWVILFRKKPLPLDQLIGFPCLVDLSDGQRLFKELRRGYTPGKWNLVSWDGSEPLDDREIVAALPLAAITPGKMRR